MSKEERRRGRKGEKKKKKGADRLQSACKNRNPVTPKSSAGPCRQTHTPYEGKPRFSSLLHEERESDDFYLGTQSTAQQDTHSHRAQHHNKEIHKNCKLTIKYYYRHFTIHRSILIFTLLNTMASSLFYRYLYSHHIVGLTTSLFKLDALLL